jgi:hypothetical protein
MKAKKIKVPVRITDKITHVRFEVFMVVAMENAIFWDVMPCGSCKNQRSSQHASVASYG